MAPLILKSQHEMEVSGQHHVPRCFMPWEKNPQYTLNQIWVCSRAGLGTLEKRRISYSVPEIKPPIIQLTKKSLYRNRYFFLL
jgi:hypothetical protein